MDLTVAERKRGKGGQGAGALGTLTSLGMDPILIALTYSSLRDLGRIQQTNTFLCTFLRPPAAPNTAAQTTEEIHRHPVWDSVWQRFHKPLGCVPKELFEFPDDEDNVIGKTVSKNIAEYNDLWLSACRDTLGVTAAAHGHPPYSNIPVHLLRSRAAVELELFWLQLFRYIQHTTVLQHLPTRTKSEAKKVVKLLDGWFRYILQCMSTENQFGALKLTGDVEQLFQNIRDSVELLERLEPDQKLVGKLPKIQQAATASTNATVTIGGTEKEKSSGHRTKIILNTTSSVHPLKFLRQRFHCLHTLSRLATVADSPRVKHRIVTSVRKHLACMENTLSARHGKKEFVCANDSQVETQNLYSTLTLRDLMRFCRQSAGSMTTPSSQGKTVVSDLESYLIPGGTPPVGVPAGTVESELLHAAEQAARRMGGSTGFSSSDEEA